MHFATPLLFVGLALFGADVETVEKGVANYQPPAAEAEAKVAERFRMPMHSFDYAMTKLDVQLSNHEIWDVTFPSPVVTPHEANNTIHCEYYKPAGEFAGSKRPAVIVLHILGGDFALSRLFAGAIAQRGTAALFVKMPYYGPRRVPGAPHRMISANPQETIAGMTQAILDIRQSVGFLSSRPEINPDELGVFGISLGGITGSLAAASEPRLKNVCLLLAGGDLGKIAWEAREFRREREKLIAMGATLEDFRTSVKEIEPLNHCANCQGRNILMLNADSDEVIPKACTEALWQAMGKPELHWYSGGHYSVLRHILNARTRVQDFYTAK